MNEETKKKWPNLGRIVMTRGIYDDSRDDGGLSLKPLLARHAAGDWGDLCPYDKSANNRDVETGGRILSSYKWRDREIWIITDAEDDNGDRQCTTILYPDEY